MFYEKEEMFPIIASYPDLRLMVWLLLMRYSDLVARPAIPKIY